MVEMHNQEIGKSSSISPRSFRDPPKSCRKRQSPTTARRLLGESLGEARRRLRRLLLEEREASQVAQTSCVEKWRKGWRRLLLEEAWGSSQRVAATTPGGSLGEARRGSRRLLLETLPEVLRDPAQTFAGRQRPKMVRRGSDDHSWRNLAGKTPESSCKHKNRKKPWGGPQALTWSGSLLSPIYV